MDATSQESPHGFTQDAVDRFEDGAGMAALHEWAELDWSDLPNGLQDIKEVVGPGAAFILAEEYGGGAVYVPYRIRDNHPLVELIGMDKACRLAETFGGDKLHIPKVDAIERQFRTRRIVKLRQAGRTVASLAREFNLTCRRVRQICAS